MNDLFSQALVEHLGWTLVHFLWQGLLVAALLAAGLFLLRNAGPNRRYLAGCLALIVLAAAPAITFHFVAGQSPALAISGIELKSSPSIPAENISKQTVEGNVPVVHRHLGGELNFSQRLEMFFPWMVMAWIFGVILFSCRLSGGWLQTRRLRRTAEMMMDEVWRERLTRLSQRLGVDQSVRLLHSTWVEVPTVLGWLRPVILLPVGCLMGLSPAQLESILAHELAHIRRHDYLVNSLQCVVETILFYHPAVWWVSRRVREERENCCDDLAVEVCGDRLVYARALATLEELRLAPAPLALAVAGPPLLPRIRRLAGQSARSTNRPAWPLAGIIVLVMIGAAGIGLRGNRAVAQENESKATNTVLHAGPYQANQVYTGRGRQEIFSKLERIRIDSIKFDHVPLTEVIHYLTDITKARDPDRLGVNYFIDRRASQGSRIDPNTGLPVATPSSDSDLASVSITIDPALSDLKLVDVLDLITRSADRPIGYSVLDYGVAFRLEGPNEEGLEQRTFHVDPNTFRQGLEGVMGVPFGNVSGTTGNGNANGSSAGTTTVIPQVNVSAGISGVTSSRAVQGGAGQATGTTNNAKEQPPIHEAVRKFFTAAGVDLSTNNAANVGKMFIWNSHKGILTVRGTPNDLIKIEAAIEKLNQSHPPTIETTNTIPPNALPKSSEILNLREYHLDPNTFRQKLGILEPDRFVGPYVVVPPTGLLADPSIGYNFRPGKVPSTMEVMIGSVFREINVNISPTNSAGAGKMFIWDNRAGVLTVRATADDLDRIDALVALLNSVHSIKGNMLFCFQRDGKYVCEIVNHDYTFLEWKVQEFNRTSLLPIRNKATRVSTNAPGSVEQKTNTVAQVYIKVQFVEIDHTQLTSSEKESLSRLLPGLEIMNEANAATLPKVMVEGVPGATNAMKNLTNSIVVQANTILTAKQYQEAISELEQRDSANILNLPEVTTESGRRAKIQAAGIQTIVTGLNSSCGDDGRVKDEYQTESLPLGPTLDVTPQVLPDDDEIAIKVIGNVMEFLGYDDGKHPPPDAPQKPAFSYAVLPLPHFRLRQMNTDVKLQDGQTLVLGGVEAERVTRVKDKVPLLGDLPLVGRLFTSTSSFKTRKDLLIFVTPTLINADGTPAHSVVK